MPKRPLLPEDLLRYVYVGDPLLSPDGARILFSHKVIDKRQAYVTSLYTVDLAGAVRKLTGATANAGGGRWSPDGARIAFTAAPDDIPQIHLIATDGGEAAAITDLPEGSISDLQWSPNGRYLAFTFRPRMEGFTKADAKQRQEEGGSPPPIVADSIWYRLDGDGYFGNTRYALYVLEVPEIGQKAEARQLYDKSPTGGYSYSWHPDSQSLIVAHSAREFPFRETPNDQLYVVNLDGGARMLPGLPSGEKSEPKYSPDGARIAYAGDVDENDPWGTRNDKIYVTNANGGAPIDLTGHDDYDMGVATLSDTAEAAFGVRMTWNADGSGLYVQVGRHGGTNIAQLGLDKSLTFVTEGDHAVKLGNVAAGRIAVTISTPSDLPEVGVIEDGVVRRLTHFNDAFHAEVETRARNPTGWNRPTGCGCRCG